MKTTSGNVFFSPYSISTACALTYAGAKGNTEKQIAETMHFAKDQKSFHTDFGSLQKQIIPDQPKSTIQLNVANGLWMQKDNPFLPAFTDVVKTDYQANLQPVDFKKSSEKVRAEINDWVAKETNDKITDLITGNAVNPQTKLVLINAIYFKGLWEEKFDSTRTFNKLFWPQGSDSIAVRMMTISNKEFLYTANDEMQVLGLPYAGSELSMIIILPKKKRGLLEIEKTIDADSIDAIVKRMQKTRIEIMIPKFKATQEYELTGALSAMGMRDAFSHNADFSAMTGNKDLRISAILHKAFIEVNEQGTEAAAATAIVMRATSIAVKPMQFIADHPFLFMIRQNSSGSILFMGRINNPK